MSDLPLELFFVRISRLDRTLKTLEKDIPELNYTSGLSEIEESELELPPDFLLQAERTIEPFKWLFTFENDLRNELRGIVRDEIKNENWFDELKMDEKTKTTVKERMKFDQDSVTSSRINSD